MKGTLYKALFLVPLMLLSGCGKEQSVDPAGDVKATIPYTVTVSGASDTRASVTGALDAGGNYVFEAGDKLYVEYKDNSVLKLYGVLNLIAGAGSESGTFNGELTCLNSFEPTDGIILSATLVGPNAAANFYTFDDVNTDGTDDVVTGRSYPSTIVYSSDFSDYVRQYSDFVGTSTYADKHFTLSQQTVFLLCKLSYLRKSELSDPSATSVDVTIKKGGSPLQTISNVPISLVNGGIGCLEFATVFPNGNGLAEAEIYVQTLSFGSFANNLSLAADHYYHVSRTRFDGLRILAKEADTQITLRFISGNDGLIEYSLDKGFTWTRYAIKVPVLLTNVGDEMWLRGTRTKYSATPSESAPAFITTNNKSCYVYGNLMSLLCVDASSWTPRTTLGQEAFQRTFKNATWIEIAPEKNLELPVTSVAKSGCKEMFYGCTGLTRSPFVELPALNLNEEQNYFSMFYGCSNMTTAPRLPATAVVKSSYNQMFYGCTSLTTAPTLPATTLTDNCYEKMFYGCTSLTSVTCLATTNINTSSSTSNWMNGVSSTGTFYKAASATWPRNANGVPSGWTINDAS